MQSCCYRTKKKDNETQNYKRRSMKPSFISKEVHAARLGVRVDATREELDSAFKKMAFLFHPDRVGQDKDFAHERFVEMKESYDYLVSLSAYAYNEPAYKPAYEPAYNEPDEPAHHNYDENTDFPDGCYVAKITTVELKTSKFDSLYVRWRFNLNKRYIISPGDNIYDEIDRIRNKTSGFDIAYKRNFFKREDTYIDFLHELKLFVPSSMVPPISDDKGLWFSDLEDSIFPLLIGHFVVIRKSRYGYWARIKFERVKWWEIDP